MRVAVLGSGGIGGYYGTLLGDPGTTHRYARLHPGITQEVAPIESQRLTKPRT
jgi:ketopantoate reductase